MKNITNFILNIVPIAIIGLLLLKNIEEPKKDDLKHEGNGYKYSETQKLKKNNIQISEAKGGDDIRNMTDEKTVIEYLKLKRGLPDFYITKAKARMRGWVSSQGNLCTKIPKFAIGGDVFYNREKKLPTNQNRIYFEADVNYNCGFRGTDRIVYSNDGLIFITHDHYKTFKKIK